MAGSIVSIFPYVGFVLLMLIFFGLLHNKPVRVFYFLTFYFAFDSSTLFDINVLITLNEVNIFVEDVFTLFLAFEMLLSLADLNLSQKIFSSKYRTLGKTFLIMSIIGLTTWGYSVGIQTAVVNWRENLLCSLLILYCFSFNSWFTYEVFSSTLYRGSVFLSILILIRVVLHGPGNFSEISAINGITDRATNASGALFLLFALWNFLIQTNVYNVRNFTYVMVISTEILILQHRSVWLSSLIGLSYLVLRLKKFRLRLRFLTLMFFIIPLLSFVVIRTPNLSAAALDSGTLSWRLLRWQSSFGQSRSEIQTLFGGITGYIESITVVGLKVAAHNMYISLFEKVGIVGAIIFLLMLIPNRENSKNDEKLVNLDLVSSITLITFGFFYSFPYVAILILFSIRRIRSEIQWRNQHASSQKYY